MCGYMWVAMVEDLTQAFVHMCMCECMGTLGRE